jgi:hypothetical protein
MKPQSASTGSLSYASPPGCSGAACSMLLGWLAAALASPGPETSGAVVMPRPQAKRQLPRQEGAPKVLYKPSQLRSWRQAVTASLLSPSVVKNGSRSRHSSTHTSIAQNTRTHTLLALPHPGLDPHQPW